MPLNSCSRSMTHRRKTFNEQPVSWTPSPVTALRTALATRDEILRMIQQEVKMVEQDFQASMKEAEEEINQATSPSEKQSGSSGTGTPA